MLQLIVDRRGGLFCHRALQERMGEGGEGGGEGAGMVTRKSALSIQRRPSNTHYNKPSLFFNQAKKLCPPR